MYEKIMKERAEMFALDIANIVGLSELCANYLGKFKETDFTYSNKKMCLDGKDHVFCYMERINDNNGWDFAAVILPERKFYMAFGFSDDDLLWIEDILKGSAQKFV